MWAGREERKEVCYERSAKDVMHACGRVCMRAGRRAHVPSSGMVWKEMTGTRARWMTCTCGVTRVVRINAAIWKRARFFVSSLCSFGVLTTRSVSLHLQYAARRA